MREEPRFYQSYSQTEDKIRRNGWDRLLGLHTRSDWATMASASTWLNEWGKIWLLCLEAGCFISFPHTFFIF